MRGFFSIGLFVLSNSFMILVWDGHLRVKDHMHRWNHTLPAVLLVAVVWLVFKK